MANCQFSIFNCSRSPQRAPFLTPLLALGIITFALAHATLAAERAYRTRNVLIAVMDGVRYVDTFGEPNRQFIPNLARLAREGTLFTNYYNTGVTITRQGHSTIATGTWQTVPNGGPRQTLPTLWEYARNELGWAASLVYVIFGKGRYSYAASSSFPAYGPRYPPTFAIDIGEKDNRDDERVLARIVQAMEADHPRLLFTNFGVTDHIGHSNNWEAYCDAVRHCDAMFGKLWEKVQSTPGYKDETTVFFTNDHGRHTDKPAELKGGFKSHGDHCEGCEHLMLLVLGPDTPRGVAVDRKALEIDLAPTAAEFLGFQTPLSEGTVLKEAFTECLGLNQKRAKTPEAERAVAMRKLAERDLLKAVADATLLRTPAELDPAPKPDAARKENPLLAGPSVELLLRGMLRAAEATKDKRYRDFVAAWAKTYAKDAERNPHVARVLLELAAKGEGEAPAEPSSRIQRGSAGASPSLAAARKCAELRATPHSTPAPDAEGLLADLFQAGFLARASAVAADTKLLDGIRSGLGLAGKTEEQLIADWRKLALRPIPMACEAPQKEAPTATLADSARFLALLDAAAAAPNDRLLRLAADLQQSACSRGIQEIGGTGGNPTVAALNLYGVLEARKLRRAHPIQWAPPAPAKNEKMARRGPKLPLWAYPEQFYNGSFPYGFNLLKCQVNEAGHYADGSLLADGAALLLFAEAKDAPMTPRLGPIAVDAGQALPAAAPGTTRVLIEMGGGQKTTWKGTVAVDKGKLVALNRYLLEANDVLDAASRTFVFHTMKMTDGLALDIEGSDETTIAVTATPGGLSFSLGDLKAKHTIEAKAPGNNFLRAGLGK